MPILAIDAGTTGVTCLVFDDERRVQGRAYAEFTQHFPEPGQVEHDAREIADTVRRVGKDALRDARLEGGDLHGIGITDQRETTLLWDRRTSEPVHRAIVWQDRRTSRRCAGLADEAGWVRDRTGLPIDPYFSATKLEWLLHEVPGAGDRARDGGLAFGTIDSWLAWSLTGGAAHVTDVTNASRTLLWDIHAGAWGAELLDLFGVPEAVLPEVVPSAGEVGRTTWFGGEVPVAALVGDQQAALFGQGCTRPGQGKNTYGTGCFFLQHTGQEAVGSDHGLLTTRAASVDGEAAYALEGSVFVAGAAIQWLRDGLKMIDAAPEVNDEAAKSDDSGGVVVVPAFAGLGAPYWDPDARGAILGLTRGTTRRHIARATLDAIASQCTGLIGAAEKDSGHAVQELRVDGGATKSDLLMQVQADLLQRPVIRPARTETTAMGSGFLAGIATGRWSQGDLGQDDEATRFEPRMAADEAERRMRRWEQAVAAVRAFKP